MEQELAVIIRARDEATKQIQAIQGQFSMLASAISSITASLASVATAFAGMSTTATAATAAVASGAQMAAMATNNLALALHQGQLSQKLMAAGAIELGTGVRASGEAAAAATGSFGKLLTMFGRYFGIAAAFYAIVKSVRALKEAFVEAFNAATEFDRALHNVWTLTDATWSSIQKLGTQVRAMAAGFAESGTQATEALYQIYSATFTGADAMTILEESLKGAAAGLSDVFSVSDMLTTVLNAYGMAASESAHINDLLFATIRYGKTTMSELAHQFGRLAGVAAPAGASIEEMTAAIATLTRQGIATDWAVTSLRQTLMQLLRPGEDLANVIEALGFESGRGMLEMLGFADAIGVISSYADENNILMEQLFSNVRAVTAVLPLATTSAREYAKDLARMESATGTASEAFEKQTESAEFAFDRLKTAWQDFSAAAVEGMTTAVAEIASYVADILENVIKAKAEAEAIRDAANQAAEAFVGESDALGKWLRAGNELPNVLIIGPFTNEFKELAEQIGITADELMALYEATASVGEDPSVLFRIREDADGAAEKVAALTEEIRTLRDAETEAFAGLGFVSTAAFDVFDLRGILSSIDEAVNEKLGETLAEVTANKAKYGLQAAVNAAADFISLATDSMELSVEQVLGLVVGTFQSAGSEFVSRLMEALGLAEEFEARLGPGLGWTDEAFLGLQTFSRSAADAANDVAVVAKTLEESLEELSIAMDADAIYSALQALGEQFPGSIEDIVARGKDLITSYRSQAESVRALAGENQALLVEAERLEGQADALESAMRLAESATEDFSAQIAAVNLSGLASGINSLMTTVDSAIASATTLGELGTALGDLQSFVGLSGYRDLFERMQNGEIWATLSPDAQSAITNLYDQLPSRDLLGQTNEQVAAEAERAAKEAEREAAAAAREAERAAREAEQAAKEAASAAQDAFREQFNAPILDALNTGDWLGAAAAIQEMVGMKDELVAQAAALSDANGQTIDAAEVLGLISGMKSELMSTVETMAELGYVSQEVVEQLKEFFDPSVANEQLRSAMEAALAANNLSEFAEITETAQARIREMEEHIERLDFWGLGDEADLARDELAAFKDMLGVATEKVSLLANIARGVGESLRASFTSLVSGLFGLLFDSASTIAESFSSSNIPRGFKLGRAAWGVATPGEPWGGGEGSSSAGFSLSAWLEDLATGIISAIADAFSSFVWDQYIDKIDWSELLSNAWVALSGFISSAYDAVYGFFVLLFGEGSVAATILASFGATLVIVVGALLALGAIIGTVEGALAILWGAVLGVGDALSAFFKPIIDAVTTSWARLQPLIDAVRSIFAALAPVMTALGKIVATGIELFTGLFVALAPLFSAIASLVSVLATVLAPIIDVVAAAFNIVLVPVIGILSSAISFLADIATVLANALIALYNYVLRPIVNAGVAVANVLVWLANAISDVIKFITFGLVNLGHVESVGNAPSLPYLQTVPGQFWEVEKEGAAIVHPGEIVGRPETGGDYNFYGDIVLPGVTDADSFAKSLQNYTRFKNLRKTGNRVGGYATQGA